MQSYLRSVNTRSVITLKTNDAPCDATLKGIYVVMVSVEWKRSSAADWKVSWPVTASDPAPVYLTEMVLAFIFPLFFLSSDANYWTMLPRCSFSLLGITPPG